MKTLTINVDTSVEDEFRAYAEKQYKGAKGFLGKAITEAMRLWLKEKRQEDISKRQIALLKEGCDFGEKLYNKRDDLYER